MLRTLLTLLGIFVTALALAAGAPTAAAPPSGVREVRAESGLRIIVRPDRSRDLVALNLYVDGGNRTEPRELSGLSHYYEHLIFRGGTKKQAELETRRAFQGIGDFGGWTSSDVTCYRFVVPGAQFDEALERFADAVLHVEVTPERVAKERDVVLSEFKMSYADSPRGWSWYECMRAAFRAHPYGRTTIGLREVIEGADTPRLRSFHEERYVPNHMVVAVVGAIDADEAIRKVTRAFSTKAPGKATFETGEVEPPQEAPRAVVRAMATEKTHATLGWKACAARADDAPAVTLLAHVLGGGESSRLEREVRAKAGLVLDAGAWFDDTRDAGLLGVSFSCEPGREAAALAAVLEEARRLREAPPAPEELQRALRKLESDFIFGGETFVQQANRLCWYAVLGDPALGADHLDRLRAVTAEDVRRVARRYLAGNRATASFVVPKAVTAPTPGSPTPPASDAEARLTAEARLHAEVKALLARLGAGDAGTEAAGTTATGDATHSADKTSARRLPTGDLLILRRDPASPVIALEVRAPDPLALEPEGKPGVAALADRLLLRGLTIDGVTLDRAAIAERLDALGARVGTAAGTDAFTGTLEAPPDRFAAGLELLLGAYLHPTFPPGELEKAREEQLAAIAAVEDDGFAVAEREQYATLLAGTPAARPPEGTEAGVRAASREDLVAWHSRVSVPGRLVLALVGPFTDAHVTALERGLAGERSAAVGASGGGAPGAGAQAGGLQDAGGRAGGGPAPGASAGAPGAPQDLAPSAVPAKAAPGAVTGTAAPEGPAGARDRHLQRPKEQVSFRLGHEGISPAHPDWIPLSIGLRHLASDVFFRFVYEEGIAYRAWTHLAGGRTAHPFTFEMGVAAPKLAGATAGLRDMLARLVAKGLTEAQVQAAKKDLLARHLLGQQTALGVADLFARCEVNGVGWRRAEDLPGLVERTGVDAVNAALRAHLRPDRLALFAVGDVKAAGLTPSPEAGR